MSQQRQDNEVIETGGPPCSRERYQRYRKSLGKGAFKSVFEGFDTEHGNLVAWNQVERGNLDGKKYDEFLKEVLTLQMLNHPSIIKMSEWWESEDKCHVVFITELMTSGDLKKYIRQRKVNLRMTRKWARQILQALDYLHTNFDHPIVHRDIKCDNIFINGNLGEVKLGDLGLSTSMTQTHAASVLGTPEFMAPEMYGESYNEKVDIYAFGMCILEIFSGQYPYEECSNPGQIFMKVNKGIPPKVLIVMENVAVKHFIESCLAPIDERPTAKELLQHELLIDLMDADAEPVPQPGARKDNPGTPTVSTLDSAQASSADIAAIPGNNVPPLPTVAAGAAAAGLAAGVAAGVAAGTGTSAEARRSSDGSVVASDILLMLDPAVKLNASSPAPQEPLKISIIDTSMQSQESGTDSDLSVVINAQIDGKQKKIQFDFNVTEDSAAEVAADLVEELMENQATKALLPHALEERVVFVEHVKELFTTSIEQAVLKLPVAVPIASPAPEAAAPALPGANSSSAAVSVERDVAPLPPSAPSSTPSLPPDTVAAAQKQASVAVMPAACAAVQRPVVPVPGTTTVQTAQPFVELDVQYSAAQVTAPEQLEGTPVNGSSAHAPPQASSPAATVPATSAGKAPSAGAAGSDAHTAHSGASSNAASVTGASVKVEVAAGVNQTEVTTQVPVAAPLLQHGSQTAHEAPSQANPQPAAAEQREPDTPTNTEEPAWYTSQKMQLVKEHTERRRELDQQYQGKYRELDKLLAQSRTPDTVPAQPGSQQTLAQPRPPATLTAPSAAAASVPSSGGL